MEYLVSIIVIAVTCYLYYLWNIYSYWRKRGIKGPPPWPFVGNYGPVLFRIKTETQILQKIYKDYPLEKFVGIFVGRNPVILVRHPQMIKQVLSVDFEQFSDRYISLVMRDYKKSLFLSPGDKNWRFLRQSISPMFNKVQLSQIIPIIKEATDNYLNRVEELLNKSNNQNIYDLKRNFLESITSEAAMGIKLNRLGAKSELQTKTAKMIELEEFEPMRVLELIFPDVLKFFKSIFLYFGKHYYDYTMNLMSRSLNGRKYNKNSNTKTMADLILQVHETKKSHGFDNDSMTENLGTMCITLLESVSTSMALIAFELARNPAAQNKCFEEINEIFKDQDEEITMDTVSSIKYLEMVIDESMRLNAVPYILDRICGTKYRFPGTNLVIDKGVYVYISVESLHGDPEYFPEPENFVPERFLNKAKIRSGAYLPFADGPRRCLGQSLAKLVMMIGMAKFLLKYKLEPSAQTPNKIKLKASSRVRRIEGGVWLNILRR